MILYVSTSGNKLSAVEVDDDGNLQNILQEIDPVVDPLPDGIVDPQKAMIVTEWVCQHPKVS